MPYAHASRLFHSIWTERAVKRTLIQGFSRYGTVEVGSPAPNLPNPLDI